MNTTFPKEVIDQLSDMVEDKLKASNTQYTREGTKFYLEFDHLGILAQYQLEANMELLDRGIITHEMIVKELDQLLR